MRMTNKTKAISNLLIGGKLALGEQRPDLNTRQRVRFGLFCLSRRAWRPAELGPTGDRR
jgi:hypothetical protein